MNVFRLLLLLSLSLVLASTLFVNGIGNEVYACRCIATNSPQKFTFNEYTIGR